jgi:hypothetical protein
MLWFRKGPKNAKRSRTVRRVEVNLGPVLRYSREKIEFSEPDRGGASKPAAPVLTLKGAPAKALPKPGKVKRS